MKELTPGIHTFEPPEVDEEGITISKVIQLEDGGQVRITDTGKFTLKYLKDAKKYGDIIAAYMAGRVSCGNVIDLLERLYNDLGDVGVNIGGFLYALDVALLSIHQAEVADMMGSVEAMLKDVGKDSESEDTEIEDMLDTKQVWG